MEGNTFRPIFLGHFIADWLLYNFASRSFQTTKLCSRLFNCNWILVWKTEKSVFEPPFGGLRGSVHTHTPSISRWKARVRLPVRHNWTFSTICYGWDVISGNMSKSAFFEEAGSLSVNISGGRGQFQVMPSGVERLVISLFRIYHIYHLVLRYWQTIISFRHNTRICQTDGQMDRIVTAIPCVALHAVTR